MLSARSADPRLHARVLTRGIVAGGVFVILVLSAVVSLAIHTAYKGAIERTQSEAQNLAITFQNEVSHILDTISQSVEVIALQASRANGDFDIYAWTREHPILSWGVVQASIIGPEGRLQSSTLEPVSPWVDLSDREHFRIHVDGKYHGVFIGRPVMGRTSHHYIIPISRRIESADGKFLGVLVFLIAPAELTTLDNSIGMKGRVLALAGLDDVILARFSSDSPDGTRGLGASIAGGERPPIIPENGHGYYIRHSVIDGAEKLYAYRRVGAYPLVVWVGLDLNAALGSTRIEAAIMSAVAAVASILFLALAVYLIREVRRRTTREIELAAEPAALQRSKERLARVIRISGIGFIECDVDAGELEWSSEARNIFGLIGAQHELTREFFYRCVHPEDREKVRQSTDLIGGGAAAAQLEYRIVRPDADVRVIYGESELLLDDPGRAMKRIITFKDITEVRRSQDRERELERQLIHSQKLEALGTLAGGIAHDLNNTLVPVLALSQMLMENVTDEDREDLQTIILATHRAKELVQQILAFSRKQEVRKAKIDPAVVIRQALQMLRSTLPANIAVIEEIDDVPEILADAGQLQQVVVNLVTNAAHAIGAANGSIAVTAERHDDFVRIQIADTGCGMEKGVLDRMFEPFFTTKGVGEGTGLGLSVAHGLVTGHGGRIEATSEPGKGTTVTIELPMGEPPIDALKAAA